MAFGAARRPATASSNVVALNAAQRRQPLDRRLAAHARLFTAGRRQDGDVFWLKENAEFLNVLQSGALPGDPVLDAFGAIHESIEARLGDFPQYYRFHLSICLDLEDLGMPGAKGEAMCRWTAAEGLAEAELSDLQRAEARRLLARRGVKTPEDGLSERLRRFMDRSRTFAIPNRKAAYELTHIVFYLSEYGRRDPHLGTQALRSLTYAGLLAFLDQNHDLLAEICVALRFAGQTPPEIWEEAVLATLDTALAMPCGPGDMADDYHCYLMSTWLAALTHGPMLPLKLRGGRARIDLAPPAMRPLREMSHALRGIRSGDWHQVRWRVMAGLGHAARRVVSAAERSTDHFGEFYEIFARTSAPER